MEEEQGAQNIEELTAWLEADDAKGRPKRARRLYELLDILPVPPERLSFQGGDVSAICFEEVRRCYLDGSDMAVVPLWFSVCREGTGGGALCGRLGESEEGATACGAGKGVRRRIGVGARMGNVPRARRSEELACPLSRAGKFDVADGSNHRGGCPGQGGAREGCEARRPGDGEDCEAPVR